MTGIHPHYEKLLAMFREHHVILMGSGPQIREFTGFWAVRKLERLARKGVKIVGINGIPSCFKHPERFLSAMFAADPQERCVLDIWGWNKIDGITKVTTWHESDQSGEWIPIQATSDAKISSALPNLMCRGSTVSVILNLLLLSGAKSVIMLGVQYHGAHAYAEDQRPLTYNVPVALLGIEQVTSAMWAKKIPVFNGCKDSRVISEPIVDVFDYHASML